jgi:hypothetical protein
MEWLTAGQAIRLSDLSIWTQNFDLGGDHGQSPVTVELPAKVTERQPRYTLNLIREKT